MKNNRKLMLEERIDKIMKDINIRGHSFDGEAISLHTILVQVEITSLPRWIKRSENLGGFATALIQSHLISRISETKDAFMAFWVVELMIRWEINSNLLVERVQEKFLELAKNEAKNSIRYFCRNAQHGSELRDLMKNKLM
jgi:hypothetical protein